MGILLKGKYYLGLLLVGVAAVLLVRAEERFDYRPRSQPGGHSAALGADGLGLVEGDW